MLHPLLPPVVDLQPELLIAPNDHVAELFRLLEIGVLSLLTIRFNSKETLSEKEDTTGALGVLSKPNKRK